MNRAHLDEEQLERLLHRELAPALEAAAREHVAGCTDCHARLVAAEREWQETADLLGKLDHGVPRIPAGAVIAKARGVVWGRRVAGVLIALGLAGAAYAMPGSPLPVWVETVARLVRGGPDTPPGPQVSPIPDPGEAGIAVDPGRDLIIAFTPPPVEGEARVVWSPGRSVVVRTLAGSATFSSDPNRLEVHSQGVAAFAIEVPLDAPRVEIQVGGRRVFLKEGSRVTTGPAVETAGGFLLRFGPAAR
jgi:hypothetical protein